jgi:hypothetical protein
LKLLLTLGISCLFAFLFHRFGLDYNSYLFGLLTFFGLQLSLNAIYWKENKKKDVDAVIKECMRVYYLLVTDKSMNKQRIIVIDKLKVIVTGLENPQYESGD